MLETATHIEPTVEIKDDRFDVGLISNCTLKLDLSKNRFQFCVVNNQNNTCLWLEDYQFSFIFSENSLVSNVNQIYQEHHFLPANYWESIYYQINTKIYSFIPKSVYKSEEALKYLQFLTGLQLTDKYSIFEEVIEDKEMVCVYAIEKELLSWFKNMYPTHRNKPIPRILTFMNVSFQNATSNSIHISFEDDFIDVIYWKKGQLQLINHYSYKTINDLEYFLLMICNEMDCLNPGVDLYLYNEITPFSESFQVIERNFSQRRFAHVTNKIKFSQYFQDLPEHRYCTLFSINIK
jgi:hypothetical protein